MQLKILKPILKHFFKSLSKCFVFQAAKIENALSSYLPERAISQTKGLRFWSDKLQKAHKEVYFLVNLK